MADTVSEEDSASIEVSSTTPTNDLFRTVVFSTPGRTSELQGSGRKFSTPVGIDSRRLVMLRGNADQDGSDDSDSAVVKPAGRRRANSLYGTSPVLNFGPKASIMRNSNAFVTVHDPSSQRLTWSKPPTNVLVIKKILDDDVLVPFREIVNWLQMDKKMKVFVEESVLREHIFKVDLDFQQLALTLATFREGLDCLTDKIDFIICLGGDGTLLYASSLFQQSVPPLMAFHHGSLGFLTPFHFEDFKAQVEQVIEGHSALILRNRFQVTLKKSPENVSSAFTDSGVLNGNSHEIFEGTSQYTVLNEVVINRGSGSFLCQLELLIEDRLVTTVQGDGLIISTPTGSTAYACAAGASMVHPNVPAIVIVPICPHSLSFRPIVVPAGVEVKVNLAPGARNTAWVTFDGRHRQEINVGDSVHVTTSIHPLPSICHSDPMDDWFESLADCLHWNVRRSQKSVMSHRDSRVSLSDSCRSESPHS